MFFIFNRLKRQNTKDFTLKRIFWERSDGSIEARHYLFILSKRLQKKGLSKAVFKELYTEYQRMGVRYITTDANLDVGGYTWTKYGFNANGKNHALAAIRKCEDKEVKKEATKFIEDYYKQHGLKEWEPFPMHLLATQPYGKKALLGGAWSGTLDLSDAKQVAVFEKYIGV